MLERGDRVSVLDEDLEGKVIRIHEGMVELETVDGFVLSFPENEVVRIGKNLEDTIPSDQESLQEVLKQKELSKKPRNRKVRPKDRNLPPMEVDLHIHKLVPRSGGMSNYEILTIQMDTAKRQLEFAMKKRIQKVVFIHGVGEGILRAELETLFRRYDNLKYYDADYQKYGLGATEVYIYQNY